MGLSVVLLCCLSWVAAGQRYTNPVLHSDYSDPDVCRVGEDYYMTASSFNCMPGLPVLHSSDLVHWTLIAYALQDYPAFDQPVAHGKGAWAPSIRYHDGWFYIFCGDPDRGIFMVRSQDPRGPWTTPVWVVEAQGFIDPCPFWEEDGSAWLVHGCAGSRAGLKSVLFLAPLNADASAVTGPSRIIYDGHLTQPTIEGPKVYRRGEWYYIFAPAGGVATGWQSVLRARSLDGPYEERVVMAWAPGTINGPHQGAWVSTPGGEDWFLHFQDKGAYGRIVHLQPMVWRADAWPVIGEDPDGDGVGQPVAGGSIPSHELHENALKHVTEPAGPYGLALAWQYPAVPSPYWHQALPNGGVRLYSVEQKAQGLWDSPNLLSQKFPAESFTVEATLAFMPNPQLEQHGETAGFAVTGNSYAALQLQDTRQGVQLQFIVCEKASEGASEEVIPLCDVPWDAVEIDHRHESRNVPLVKYPSYRRAVVRVRLEVKPRERAGDVPEPLCQFSYSLDGGKKWQRVPQCFVARPELWIGAKFGFYCNRPARKNDAGWLEIQDLSIN
ncbi:MAG: family 43 glycosylhydrolase [Bacteroidales bacterium]|nr:family 43 glycosylhydrolase [Bacteroidales bacterium]